MNRQFSREEVQQILQRWHQLRNQFGEQAVNVPEFAHLSKIIKFLQHQNQQVQQQRKQTGNQKLPPQGQSSISMQNVQSPNSSLPIQGQGTPNQQSNFINNNNRTSTGNNIQIAKNNTIMSNDKTPMYQQQQLPNSQQQPPPQLSHFPLQQQQPPPQQLPPQQQEPNRAQFPYANDISNIQSTDSAFTNQQFQLVKAQYQALKFLLKTPGTDMSPIPQNLINFVMNDSSAFPNGQYLPSSKVNTPQTGQSTNIPNSNVSNINTPNVNTPNVNTPNVNSAVANPNFSISNQNTNASNMNTPNMNTPNINNTNLGTQNANISSMNIPNPSIAPANLSFGNVSNSNVSLNVTNLNESVANQIQPNSGLFTPGSLNDSRVSNTPPFVNERKISISRKIPKPRSPSVAYKKPVNKRPLKEDDSVKNLVPMAVEANPPVLLDDLEIRKDDANTLVVNVSNPDLQVDSFDIPSVCNMNVDEIPFHSVYNPQSRVQFPSLLPYGIDITDIQINRESIISLKIDEEINQLRRKLEETNLNNIEERKRLEEKINELELLPFQKQLRGKVLSHVWFSESLLPNSHPNFLGKFSTLSIENVTTTRDLYRSQLYSMVKAQNQKHKSMINIILENKKNKSIVAYRKKEKVDKCSSKISSFHNQVAREEQKKLEKMAKQRLQALKSNDEEAYLKLLDHTKDTRITHLLNQTNQFLDTLSQAVQSQQRDAQSKFSSNRAKADEKVDTAIDDEKREKMDYYHVAHRIKEEVTKQPTILVGGTLKEYQLKGLQWMVSLFNNHLNGILADEMGLGKTIQTISLITYLVEVKQIPGPFLVIVPLSTLTNWNLEFEKWAPSVKKITYKGTPNQRKIMQQEIRQGNFQILLTTFEYIIKDKALLSKIKWIHMIIDEGHRMKNSNSKLSETLTHNYHSDYRLILTGTPLQNNLPELWALLNFVLPKIFNSVKSFDEWFNTPFANTGGQDKIELSEEETLLVIRRLHKVLRPFLLRRLKKDVEKDLPNKVEKVVKCKMSSVQSKLYQQMLKHNVLFAGDPENPDVPITIKNANNQIMQLRKICNHPFVYEEVENLISPVSETNDQIWRVAGKFELLDRILPKFKKTGHRVLIFFQMTQIMDIMEDFLRLRGLKYMRLDGSTKADDRTGLLKLFNAENSEYFCFLLSTRAGGLGLNLQTADTVIIFDTDWNPHQDLQAQDRAHRIGQKNEVRILRLITEDSVEEMILERAHAKLEIDGKVIQAGKFDNKSTAEEQEALLRALIEKEDERKQKGGGYDDDDLDDDELNQVIARNDNEIEIFRKLDEARLIETKEASYPTRLFSDQELPEIYKKDPSTFLQKDIVSTDEYGRGTRERKTASYDDNLTEEQWLKKIDGMVSDDDSDDDIKPKRLKARSRNKKVSLLDDETVDSPGIDLKRKDEIDPFDNEGNPPSKRQKSSTPRPPSRTKSKRQKTKGKTLSRSTPSIDPLTIEQRERLQTSIEAIYNSILNYTNEHGRILSDLFLVKPSRKFYPDYYVLIKNPLALDTVKRRFQTKTYSHIREFLEDLHLIFSNAKIYNEEGSIVYEDAKLLETLAIDKFKEIYPDLTENEITKIIDFTEFDEIYNLKPLTMNPSLRNIVDSKLESLDASPSVESFDGITS